MLGPNGQFRNSSFTEFFNPTSRKPPFFQIFDPDFLDILGPTPSFHEVASNAAFAFAHEAPIYVPETDEVFFASNDGGALGNSDLTHNNQVGKISMQAVETALQDLKAGSGTAVNVSVTEVSTLYCALVFSLRLHTNIDHTHFFLMFSCQVVLPDTIQMTNGGTGPLKSSLVLITSGRGPLPPSIALVNPNAPHNVTVLLDNFFGRQFNSLNDIKIHPATGALFFTDVT